MVKYLAIRDSNKRRQIASGYDAKFGNCRREKHEPRERERKMSHAKILCATAVLLLSVLVGTSQSALIPVGTYNLTLKQGATPIASAINVPVPANLNDAMVWADYDVNGNIISGTEWTIAGHEVTIEMVNYNYPDPNYDYVQWWIRLLDGNDQPVLNETLLSGQGPLSVYITNLDFAGFSNSTATPQYGANLYMMDAMASGVWSYHLPDSQILSVPKIYQIPKQQLQAAALNDQGSFVMSNVPVPDQSTMIYHDGGDVLGNGYVYELSYGMAFVTPVPEPGTIFLLGLAAATMTMGRCRPRRR